MGNITPQTPPSFRCRCKKLKPHELLRGKLCLPAVSQGSAREKGKEENKCIKKKYAGRTTAATSYMYTYFKAAPRRLAILPKSPET